jgi:hypothetical protein
MPTAHGDENTLTSAKSAAKRFSQSLNFMSLRGMYFRKNTFGGGSSSLLEYTDPS